MQHPTTLATTGHQAISGSVGLTVFVMVENEKKETSFSKKSAYGLAIVQIILGIASILAQTVLILNVFISGTDYSDYAGGVGEGIYCGIFFIISGSLGKLASRKPTMCCISAFMTLSIIASIFSCIQIIMASIKLGILDQAIYGREYPPDREPKMAVLSIIVVAGAVEMIVAIICAAICSGACCCPGNGSSAGKMVYLAQEENALGAVSVQMNGGVPVQMAGSVPVQIPYLSQANPFTGAKQLNEFSSYGDAVRGDEQETKDKYGMGGYVTVEN